VAETKNLSSSVVKRSVKYGLAVSEEVLGPQAPVLIQGGLLPAIRRASALGFDAVEIHIRNPSEFDAALLARTASDNGVDISALGTGLEYSLGGLSLTSHNADIRRRTVDRFKEHIDLAARLDATVFVGLCRGTAPDLASVPAYLERFAEELIRINDHADASGVVLSLEPIAAYMTNLLVTTVETIEFLHRPGLESIMLLLDTHHMYLEDGDIGAAFDLSKGRIGHLHISDSDRKFGVSGKIDYNSVGENLKRIEYNKTVSLEVLPDPDGETAALKGLAWMLEVWGD
jgi:sugar phosphate isomerase/epimerase